MPTKQTHNITRLTTTHNDHQQKQTTYILCKYALSSTSLSIHVLSWQLCRVAVFEAILTNKFTNSHSIACAGCNSSLIQCISLQSINSLGEVASRYNVLHNKYRSVKYMYIRITILCMLVLLYKYISFEELIKRVCCLPISQNQ